MTGMVVPQRNAAARWLPAIAAVVLLAAPSTCLAGVVDSARRGEPLVAPEGKALVFTRIRFYYDGREIFPWKSSRITTLFGSRSGDARHIWLRRLDVTAASWELWPDKDGLLTIWLPPGDYALFGTEDDPATDPRPVLAAVALLRVPSDQPVVYAGELVFADEFREGWHAHYIFGSGSVTTDSMTDAAGQVEARYSALPGPPATSAWCVGRHLPSSEFNSEFVSQSRQLLDAGCPTPP